MYKYDKKPNVNLDQESPVIQKVQSFIDSLKNQRKFPDVNNFYAESNEKSRNLKLYLLTMIEKKPELLFLGEAPGIKGCYLTGIPFTSERILQSTSFTKHFKGNFLLSGNEYEHSANMLWKEVQKLNTPPLLWNIFPLHPYEMIDNKCENRAPLSHEKEWGKLMLIQLLELFPNIKIFTIGRHAQKALKEMQIKTEGHMTHPRLAKKFREDFAKLFL